MAETAVPAAPARWRGRAFGLELEGDFHACGLLDLPPAGAPKPATRIERVPGAALAAAWQTAGSARLHETRATDGRSLLTIDEHERAGYRLRAPAYGDFVVSADGAVVRCLPAPGPEWVWQSFLIGQVLPIAAVLRGLEVLHASAVTVCGRAVAFIGCSGAGKSSLAVNMLRRGAGFLADDVVALQADGDRVIAHAGPGLASVRLAEAGSLGSDAVAALGAPVGRDEHELRVAVPRAHPSLELGALYVIERSATPVDEPVHEVWPPDPRLLLAHTYTRFVLEPRRLTRQLDVCSLVTRRVPICRAVVTPELDAAALAEAVERHATALLSGAGAP